MARIIPNYTLTDLFNSETYKQDPALSMVTDRIAETEYRKVTGGKISMAEFRNRLFYGWYPELVKAHWDRYREVEMRKGFYQI